SVPSRRSIVFLLHVVFEGPLAAAAIWSPASLPLIQLTNTTLLILKLYAALLLGTCVTSLLCWGLPEFLPGKRAFAIGLCIYHTTLSTVLYQAPRVVPVSFGALAEAYKITPETVSGTVHGLLGLGMVLWWQTTLNLIPRQA
ncbi:hypothetical protein FISHEDRAFT_44512, partial [Fistulina hepatica ATCC 64428]